MSAEVFKAKAPFVPRWQRTNSPWKNASHDIELLRSTEHYLTFGKTIWGNYRCFYHVYGNHVKIVDGDLQQYNQIALPG